MLSKAQRIDKTTFKTLTGRGMSFNSPLLFLSLYPQHTKTQSRFAVLCSKKVSAKAVDRNRQRRRVYRSIQHIYSYIKPGFYVVCTLKKEAKESTFAELDATVKKLIRDARLVD